MRRWATLVAAVTLAVGLAACGSSSKSSSGSSNTTTAGGDLFSKLPSAIQASKQLEIGSDIEYPPIEFFKEGTTEVQGVDYDLAQAMAAKLGVTVKFINDTDFAGIIGALQAGRFDLDHVGDERHRRTAGQRRRLHRLLHRRERRSSSQKGNPKGIQTLDDLCGNTVAVQKGTVQDTDVITPQIAKCKTAGKTLTVLRVREGHRRAAAGQERSCDRELRRLPGRRVQRQDIGWRERLRCRQRARHRSRRLWHRDAEGQHRNSATRSRRR